MARPDISDSRLRSGSRGAKLRAHRGDEAAHGRKAPAQSEIRYLLFQVCNLALLLLDQEVAKP